jgi:hypothetical protein
MTADTKEKNLAGEPTRLMIAPKASVHLDSEADRQRVIEAARAVIQVHRDVIHALAKR